MANQQFYYPLLHWERPYHGEICTELNIERYSLNKDGTIDYHHPQGTHEKAKIALSPASTLVSELEEAGLIVCLNAQYKIGKLYVISDEGKEIITKMNS